MPAAAPTTLAAVDLGSNSFHLQVARIAADQLYPLDSHRETVRLGGGVTPDRKIDQKTAAHALDTLKLFAERLRGMSPDAVRAVGTNALRIARNAQDFMREAEAVLGFPIEIISGREEARLIYLGVAHSLPASNNNRIVVDIGGGSTEFIIGYGLKPKAAESLYMGCVTYTQRFFPDARVDKKSFRQAELAAQREVETITARFNKVGWKESVGSSGTAKALAGILQENRQTEGNITLAGLEWLKAQAIKAGSFEDLKIPGLRDDRIPVLPGGLAIMIAVFEELEISRMAVAEGALRQGVLYDLLGRSHHADIRDPTVAQLAKRYHVDLLQAERVGTLALRLLKQIKDDFDPKENESDYRLMQLLKWASHLHEIGIDIAQSAFHKHSAYIIANADMPGFSRQEQTWISRLVLAQRGRLNKVGTELKSDRELRLLTFCLRLAVLLYRSRRGIDLRQFEAKRNPEGFQLRVNEGWLAQHSLTEYGLKAEAGEWEALGYEFEFAERG
jgi:exopolyphosphatase / guanosine-5'-triphosphate,3'-diphosphate pyrophosphatase